MEVTKSEEGSVDKSRSSVTLDEALSMAKFGRFNVILIVISGTIMTAFLLEVLGISYVLAVTGQDLQISTKEKGVLSAVGFAGVILSSHLWGFLADTYGRRKVIIPTLFASLVISTMTSFMASFWWITFFRFLAGFVVSGPSGTIYAYLGEFHSRSRASQAIMAASFAYGIGGILLPGIAYVVINQEWQLPLPLLGIIYRPWRLYFVVCSLPGLVCALVLLYFPESPKFLYNQGSTDKAIEAIKWVHRFNTGRKEPPLVVESLQDDTDGEQTAKNHQGNRAKGFCGLMTLVWNQTAPLFKSTHLRKTAIVCFLQFGTYLTAHGMFMFFPEIVNQLVLVLKTGVTKTTVCQVVYEKLNFTVIEETADVQNQENEMLDSLTYALSFVIEVIYAVGFAVIGVIINKVGRLSVLVFVFVTCGMAGVLAIFINVPTAAIVFYVILLLSGYTASVINAVVVDLYPTSLRAMAVCIALMFGRLGSVVGSNMLGLLLENHCELAFGISCALLFVCAALSFFIPSIRQRKQSEMK